MLNNYTEIRKFHLLWSIIFTVINHETLYRMQHEDETRPFTDRDSS